MITFIFDYFPESYFPCTFVHCVGPLIFTFNQHLNANLTTVLPLPLRPSMGVVLVFICFIKTVTVWECWSFGLVSTFPKFWVIWKLNRLLEIWPKYNHIKFDQNPLSRFNQHIDREHFWAVPRTTKNIFSYYKTWQFLGPI